MIKKIAGFITPNEWNSEIVNDSFATYLSPFRLISILFVYSTSFNWQMAVRLLSSFIAFIY